MFYPMSDNDHQHHNYERDTASSPLSLRRNINSREYVMAQVMPYIFAAYTVGSLAKCSASLKTSVAP
jgi:hypothetical protein